MLRQLYVRLLRGSKKMAARLGLLAWLERHSHWRLARWLRSLFAIYDSDDLIYLDLAWWTFAAQSLVDAFLRDKPGASVFEYGAGASSVWLARRGARLVSVDHDAAWITRLRPKLALYPKLELRHVQPTRSARPRMRSGHADWQQFDFYDYVNEIDTVDGQFDLIVIDGRCRCECLQKAQLRLKPGGMIVFDNASRKRYRAALHAVATQAVAMQTIATRGLTACLPYPDATTLFINTAAEQFDAALEAEHGSG